MISFQCPHCGFSYSLDEEHAGKTYSCRQCRKPVTVPLPMPDSVKAPVVSPSPSLKTVTSPVLRDPSPSVNFRNLENHTTSKTSLMAVFSLALGILSYFCMTIICSIPAIILGHLSLAKIKKSSGALKGKGLAVAGLVLAYINFAVFLLLLLLLFGGILSLASLPFVGSMGKRGKASDSSSGNAFTTPANLPAPGRNDVVGSLMLKLESENVSVPIRGEYVYIIQDKLSEKIRQDIQSRKKDAHSSILSEESARMAEKDRAIQTLKTRIETNNQNLAQNIKEREDLVKQIAAFGASDKIQEDRNSLATTLESLKEEYARFQRPEWNRFRVKTLGEERSALTSERPAYNNLFEETIAKTQQDLSNLEEKIRQIQPILQKISEIQKKDEQFKSEIDLDGSNIKEEEARHAEYLKQGDARIISANKSLFSEIRNLLQQNNDIGRIQTNLEGKFIYTRKKGPHILFALYAIEPPLFQPFYWEFKVSAEDKSIVVDERHLRRDIAINKEDFTSLTGTPSP
jgi:hypothetical protein